MAASAPGTSSETEASYCVWLVGAGPTANTVAEATRVEPMRSADGRALAGLGDGDHLDGVTGDEGYRRHLVALQQHADDLLPRGELGCARQHLLDHHLAGVDGGVELLADQGGRADRRHGRDVARGRNRRRTEVAGGEDGAGRQALGRHDDRHSLGRGLEQRAGYRRAHEHQRDAEADLPGAALVGAGGQAQAAAGSRRSAGTEGGRCRRGGCGHRSSSSSVVDGFDLGDLQRGRRRLRW